MSINKFLAKMASGQNKPNGLTVILPEDAIAFVEQLPIEKFHGIGEVTAAKMHSLGIHTGADLKMRSSKTLPLAKPLEEKASLTELTHHFGKAGQYYITTRLPEQNMIAQLKQIEFANRLVQKTPLQMI